MLKKQSKEFSYLSIWIDSKLDKKQSKDQWRLLKGEKYEGYYLLEVFLIGGNLTELCLYMPPRRVHSRNMCIDKYIKVNGSLINIIFMTFT